MTKAEVMKELQSLGSEATKAILSKHGAREPFFGVKVEDLKKVMKKIKNDQQLAMELYETGNSDAMYLAGIISRKLKTRDTLARSGKRSGVREKIIDVTCHLICW